MTRARIPTLAAVLFALGTVSTLDAEVRPWKPVGISSPLFESHAAFDPQSGDLYFVRSSPAFEGWRILVSRCTAKGWSEPTPPVFAGDGVEADPYFTADGRTLYFIFTLFSRDTKGPDSGGFSSGMSTARKAGRPTVRPEFQENVGSSVTPRRSHRRALEILG